MARQVHESKGSAAAILILLSLLTGCGTKQRLVLYPGLDQSGAGAARIIGQFKNVGWFDTMMLQAPRIIVYLRTVDGMAVSQGWLPRQTEAVVAPVIHTVTFDFSVEMNHPEDPDQILTYVATSRAPLAVRFSAEANHEYEIRIAYAPNQKPMPWYGGDRFWRSSVVDRQTEKPVQLLQSSEGESEETAEPSPPN